MHWQRPVENLRSKLWLVPNRQLPGEFEPAPTPKHPCLINSPRVFLHPQRLLFRYPLLRKCRRSLWALSRLPCRSWLARRRTARPMSPRTRRIRANRVRRAPTSVDPAPTRRPTARTCTVRPIALLTCRQDAEIAPSIVNSIDDWCIFAPPEPGPDSVIGNTERIEVSWCIKPGYGTRLIPDGAITGAHFVQTPDYVQVTGVGNLTLVNIPDQDEGGELDPHGADGNGALSSCRISRRD